MRRNISIIVFNVDKRTGAFCVSSHFVIHMSHRNLITSRIKGTNFLPSWKGPASWTISISNNAFPSLLYADPDVCRAWLSDSIMRFKTTLVAPAMITISGLRSSTGASVADLPLLSQNFRISAWFTGRRRSQIVAEPSFHGPVLPSEQSFHEALWEKWSCCQGYQRAGPHWETSLRR